MQPFVCYSLFPVSGARQQAEERGGASLISGLVPANVASSSKAERAANSWHSVRECLTELAVVGQNRASQFRVVLQLSCRSWLKQVRVDAVEDSTTGMATAIREVRALTLTTTSADNKQPQKLDEMVSQYQMREAETQLKLAVVESLENALQTQLNSQRAAADEGTGKLQVLMTKYCAAWSTLPYCDHDELPNEEDNKVGH